MAPIYISPPTLEQWTRQRDLQFSIPMVNNRMVQWCEIVSTSTRFLILRFRTWKHGGSYSCFISLTTTSVMDIKVNEATGFSWEWTATAFDFDTFEAALDLRFFGFLWREVEFSSFEDAGWSGVGPLFLLRFSQEGWSWSSSDDWTLGSNCYISTCYLATNMLPTWCFLFINIHLWIQITKGLSFSF